MSIMLNGQSHDVPQNTSIAALLETLNLAGGKGVAVELNLEVVPRSQHAATVLEVGDRIEVVNMVGGG
ncbi:MAG: thiamine biosynthesis protein ThiS [Alphaproteobacteria bacterium CG_4_10_14_0_2_um_filter_63_37]|nr:MAG: thiamine biosynthesis protein ThiS [Proteobacteria bacterium CG1_02_64_396]PJA24425.1 MAG: thiamine biosynthesis protein ThiS [Alphaproteobacteria bacterium CG_4_10_14_0_2_um_filter_63_37]